MAIVAYLFLVSLGSFYNISVGIMDYNIFFREVWSYEFIQLSYLYSIILNISPKQGSTDTGFFAIFANVNIFYFSPDDYSWMLIL